jgi:hypothetical protein
MTQWRWISGRRAVHKRRFHRVGDKRFASTSAIAASGSGSYFDKRSAKQFNVASWGLMNPGMAEKTFRQ